MSELNERLDNLKQEIQQEEFLEGKGLSNEVNIYRRAGLRRNPAPPPPVRTASRNMKRNTMPTATIGRTITA